MCRLTGLSGWVLDKSSLLCSPNWILWPHTRLVVSFVGTVLIVYMRKDLWPMLYCLSGELMCSRLVTRERRRWCWGEAADIMTSIIVIESVYQSVSVSWGNSRKRDEGSESGIPLWYYFAAGQLKEKQPLRLIQRCRDLVRSFLSF